MIRLSKRLQAVADLVSKGTRVCDVGTDHAYIPIYLIQTGRMEQALAMDVNEGPLLRAREHVAEQELSEYIVLRRSDGLAAIGQEACDSVVIAGMGGGLMMRILSEGADKLASVKELILQPQSDIELVRRYVKEHGFTIDRQDMVKEDGKYYMMFRCIPRENAVDEAAEEPLRRLAGERYGTHLVYGAHPVLREFLQKEETVIGQIRLSLENGKKGTASDKRMEELDERQQVIDEARRMMRERK